MKHILPLLTILLLTPVLSAKAAENKPALSALYFARYETDAVPEKMMYADTTRRGRPWSKNPFVLRFGDRYLMYSSILPVPGSKAREIEITESRDFVHWKNVGILRAEQPYEKNGISAPCALVKDGKVHLFYQTYGNGKNDAICHAVSEDGVTGFNRNTSNPVFRPDGKWNCGRAIDAEVFFHEGRYLMYFATRDPDFNIQMQGVAATPENILTGHLARRRNPCRAIRQRQQPRHGTAAAANRSACCRPCASRRHRASPRRHLSGNGQATTLR